MLETYVATYVCYLYNNIIFILAENLIVSLTIKITYAKAFR